MAVLLLAGGSSFGQQPAINTIYVVQFSHADVGFNAPPSVMEQRNHDRTVAALDLADTYPEFKWTIETAYQLENFLDRASPVDAYRLLYRLWEGRFAFGANYASLHSGITSKEEHDTLIDPALRIVDYYNFPPPEAAFLDDVPGFTLATPDVLEANGVPYAVLGPNDSFGGKPDIPLNDRPFWWEGGDGSRVLTWMTWGSYIEGYFDWGLNDLASAERYIPMRLKEFIEAGYPYDAVLVDRASDDEFPDASMVQLARQWNNTHPEVEIRLATADEFFEHLLATYGDVFPVYRGDASGQWESGASATPATTALVRRARSRLPDAEALWAFLAGRFGAPYPAGRFAEAWKLALLFDDHNGGGAGWPGLLTKEEIEQQNLEFVAMATQCRDITDGLLQQALGLFRQKLTAAGASGLFLLNPADADFDDVVEIDCGGPQRASLSLIDANTGVPVIFRWTKADRSALAFRAQIPANGYHRWRIAGGGTTPPAPAWSAGNSITAGNLRLVMDPAGGTVSSLRDESSDIEWIDQSGPHLFGGLEKGTDTQVFWGLWQPVSLSQLSIQRESPSAVFRSIRVVGDGGEVLAEYRLFDHETRIDANIFLRRSQLPFVPYSQGSLHFAVAFPANLSLPTTFSVDGPGGWFTPGPDSLPGAPYGHFGCANGARLVGAGGRWVSVSSVDSPIVDLGEMDESPLPAIETDETSLTWRLIRHASLTEVSGGAHVPFVAEPGMPDVTPFVFRIRFGDVSTPPPADDAYRRDLAPPQAIWISPR